MSDHSPRAAAFGSSHPPFLLVMGLLALGCGGEVNPRGGDGGGADGGSVVRDAGSADGSTRTDAGGVDAGPPAIDAGSDGGTDAGPQDYEMCPPPGGQDCSPLAADCSWGFDPPSCFYSRVVAAIGATQAAHPEWFARNDEYSCDAIAVGFDDDYMAEVVQRLNGSGLCAFADTSDEIAVKLNGTYSEQFDIIADPAMRTGPPPRCVRSGGGSYMGRNVPACF